MIDQGKAATASYGYASGRIRAMESQLFDTARYSRLFEARSAEDVTRLLLESGYPQADQPEDSLSRENIRIYELILQLMDDSRFTKALLLPHDLHNLKVILKTLSPWWPQPDEVAEEVPDKASAEGDGLPRPDEAFEKNKASDYASIRHLFLEPASIPPQELYQSMVQRQPQRVPEWAYAAAVAAVGTYLQSYDISDIDRILEQHAYRRIWQQALSTGHEFFIEYHRSKLDLIHISMLLRLRHRRESEKSFADMMLPTGRLDQATLLEWFSAQPEALAEAIRRSPYPSLAPFAESYGQAGSAAKLGLAIDNLHIGILQSVRYTLSGPQIPLAYLWAREFEIKNVRIALACIRNGLKMDQARDLARMRHWDWR